MAAPGAASVGSASFGAATDIVIPGPATAGAYQIAIISVTVNTETLTTVPSGWTLRAQLSLTTPNSNVPDRGNTQYVWIYSQDTPGTADATFVKSGTRRYGAVRISWPAVIGTPTWATPVQSNNATTHTTPSSTPPANTDVKVVGIAVVDQGPAPVTLSAPGSPWSTVFAADMPTPAISEAQSFAVVEQTIAATASPSAVSTSFTTGAVEEAFLVTCVLPGTTTGGGGGGVPARTRAFLSLL